MARMNVDVHNTLNDRMYIRYKSGLYSDLTIICGDKRISVHKWTLAAQSTYFEAAFYGVCAEANGP